jgi:SAM-dependent methyltransferase
VPDASFDTVLCREALMLVAEPPVAARETHRVMVPSGRAVFAVWGPPEDNPWLSTLINAVSAQLRSPVPPPGMPGPFALSGDGALAEVLTAGGFTDVAVRGVQSPMQMGTFDEWWNVVPSLAGPIAPILASLPTELTAAIRADAEAALAEFRTDNGYELPGLSLVGVGRNAVAQRRKE